MNNKWIKPMNEELNLNNLKSMQAFVGSHFMFNVLNQVQNRFLAAEPEEGVQVISIYNKMLRYALKCSETGSTFVADEWQFLKNYLAAEQMRFEGNITISMGPESLSDTGYMPAFLLQPVLEATLHSAQATGNHSEINIVCEELKEGRQFRISSNCPAAETPEKYLQNISRVKDRIKVWNKNKKTSITLHVEGDSWLMRLTK